MSVLFKTQLSRRLESYQASYFKHTIFLAPLVFILGLVALKLASVPFYWRLIAREDGPIEYLTGLVYLLAFLVALSIGKRFYRQGQGFYGALYLFLSLGFLFICLEEISWGQRIFGVSSPEVFETYNQQGEMNLHNFAGRYALHAAYILVGAYGAFAHFVIPKRLTTRFRSVVPLLVPGGLLFLYFFPVFALYTYYDYLSPLLVALFGPQFGWEFGRGYERFIISKDQEAAEFILSVGFLLFVGINKWRQASGGFNDLPRPKFRRESLP